jgi:tetratricopeptide (TPR) repeat protein
MNLVLAVSAVTILVLNFNKTVSLLYANLGAVQMSRVELKYFPTNHWATAEIVPELETADSSLRSALRFDPDNRTANHRLGLIAMLRGDFESAAGYLEVALEQAPEHRGIVKSLGYSYAWLGDFDKAQRLLSEIPEANDELGIYVWWWDVRGRQDLSAKAGQLVSQLNDEIHQP